MLVEDKIMVEEKAIQALAPAHEAQLVNHLTATGIEIGLLLNFGGPTFGIQTQKPEPTVKSNTREISSCKSCPILSRISVRTRPSQG